MALLGFSERDLKNLEPQISPHKKHQNFRSTNPNFYSSQNRLIKSEGAYSVVSHVGAKVEREKDGEERGERELVEWMLWLYHVSCNNWRSDWVWTGIGS
jgi:hypothetical protein